MDASCCASSSLKRLGLQHMDVGVAKKIKVHFLEGPHDKEHTSSMLGSILGSPYVGKLPCEETWCSQSTWPTFQVPRTFVCTVHFASRILSRVRVKGLHAFRSDRMINQMPYPFHAWQQWRKRSCPCNCHAG